MAYWCYERESLQRLISSFFDKKRAEGSNLKETKHVAMMGLAQAGTENKSSAKNDATQGLHTVERSQVCLLSASAKIN
jgi:hypothetical protein